MKTADVFLGPLRQLHEIIRDAVVSATASQQTADLSRVDREDASDTIYAIDVVTEDLLRDFFTDLSAQHSHS